MSSESTSLTAAQSHALAELLRRVSTSVDALARRFRERGHELALVGGPVRDALLGRNGQDLDLTTDAPPEAVIEIAEGWADAVWTIGIDFGTVGLRKGKRHLEITTYRSESYDPGSRKPQVRYGKTLEGDLRRRDFTVNAMAARLPDVEFVDPFGGLRDLRDGILRTPGLPEESFGDDPLRMLRAARFAAALAFRLAPEVVTAMTEMASRIDIVSAERIRDELTKLLLAGHPRPGIVLLVETGLAGHVLPELPRLREATDEHRRHKDVYEHSLTVLDQAIELEDRYGLRDDLVVRLAALLHDIGKPKTRAFQPDGQVTFHHHEVVGAAMAKSRLAALRFPKDVVHDVARLVELHLRFHGYGRGEWTDSAVRRYVRDAGALLSRLHVLTRADCTTRNKRKAAALAHAYDNLERRIGRLLEQEELAKIRPDLDGNEIQQVLHISPGPLVGEAYRFLLEARMENGPMGKDAATSALLEWAAKRGIGK